MTAQTRSRKRARSLAGVLTTKEFICLGRIGIYNPVTKENDRRCVVMNPLDGTQFVLDSEVVKAGDRFYVVQEAATGKLYWDGMGHDAGIKAIQPWQSRPIHNVDICYRNASKIKGNLYVGGIAVEAAAVA